MKNEEIIKQLVIIGNGFDLHFNQKTSFESYIDSLSVSDESNKLFEELTFLVNKDISLNPANGQIENDSIHDIKVKIEEIFSCLDGDIPNLSSSERKILAFYIKVCCHQLEIEVIPKLKKDKYSAYSNIYNERGSLLNEFIKKIRLKKIAENRPTFWDIYFLFLKDTNELKNDVNWSDVEKRLLDFYNMPLYRTYSKEVTEYENIYKIIQSFGNRPLNWNQFQKKNFG
ncbi:MAG: hypothetical protein IAA89_03930 [Firmicutes bacterium]|uniref:Uncharacterized protein n=1 Tax=Candidatus Gallilactobacillus intestinavium TaxID=2840838 RepID=A0A9D9EAA2_9LACO|nr:hypothetical protein [Candidatus Gallilactobacillus intestinavium]